LQVVAEMAVRVLVIVPAGQIAELPLESLAAGVVRAGNAPAIAAPVAQALQGTVEVILLGEHRAALPHRHVVRRIEAEGGDVSKGSRLAAPVERAGGVAI